MYETFGAHIYGNHINRGIFFDISAYPLLRGSQNLLCIVTVYQGNIDAQHHAVDSFFSLKFDDVIYTRDFAQNYADQIQKSLIRNGVGPET